MTITDANATNVVLRALLGVEPTPDAGQVRAAAVQLAGKAHKVLMAGLTPESVAAAIDSRDAALEQAEV